jgi:hypothetical protein
VILRECAQLVAGEIMEGVEEVAVDVKDHGEWVQDLKVSVLLPINIAYRTPVRHCNISLNRNVIDTILPYGMPSRFVRKLMKVFKKKNQILNGGPREFQIMPRSRLDGIKKSMEIGEGSNPISRRILLKLQKRLLNEKRNFWVRIRNFETFEPPMNCDRLFSQHMN